MNISHEVLTKDDAIRIAKYDSTISTKPEKYVQANTLTYYLACNTWLLQIQVHDEWAVEGVKNALLTKGLLPILKELDKDSNSIVHGDAPVSDVGRLIVSITKGSAKRYFGLHPETNVLRDDMATALQLMRYLKRFSPLYNDTVQKESLKSFLQNENSTKMAQRKGYPQWLLSAVRDELVVCLIGRSCVMRLRISHLMTSLSRQALPMRATPGSVKRSMCWLARILNGFISHSVYHIFSHTIVPVVTLVRAEFRLSLNPIRLVALLRWNRWIDRQRLLP